MVITVKKTVRNRDHLLQRLKRLPKVGVLVGIPQERSSRPDKEGESNQINNAELLYIHTNGVRNHKMIREMSGAINQGGSFSSAYDMYVHSHGSPLMNVPPRPVIEPAIESNIEPINDMMKEGIKSYLISGSTAGLKRAGIFAVGASKGWFEDSRNNWAPNSPYTIRKKGSDKPLINTSEMRKSITYVVDEGVDNA